MHPSEIRTLGPFDIPGVGARRVRVLLPPRRGAAPPPALYLFDGQNVFDDAPSFAGGWRLHEAVGRISARRHRVPAIIGVEHGGVERIDELSPWPWRHGGGRAEALLAWLAGDLVPRLGAELGLAATPEGVTVGGSSMGGLCALYAHFRHPATFGGVLSMSPSLWFGGQRIFDFVASQPRPWTSRIYLDAGAHEGGGGMLRLSGRMAGLLREKGYGPDALRFRADPKGKHQEADWRRRAPAALRFLFATGRR
jgi:predicted alpha/beta superfamily hydrolase